jgi:hypothetical protein
MSEYPVFHFRFEKPKTFIQFTFKNNIVDFNLNNEFDIKIDEKKYDLNTIISLKFELNNEPEIIIDYNIKDQQQINLKINDLLSMINESKNKETIVDNVDDIENKEIVIESRVEDKEIVKEIVDVEDKEIIVDNSNIEVIPLVDDKSRSGKVRMIKERLQKERLEKERLQKERLEKERLQKERLEKESLQKESLPESKLIKNLRKDLENIKDPDSHVIDKALSIQLNMLEHLRLIISDNPEMIYTNIIHIITELMKYVETINTEDLDKKTLIIKSIKTFLQYQKMNSPETDLILDIVCPELIDVLLLVDKRKIVFKKKFNCFLPWCA